MPSHTLQLLAGLATALAALATPAHADGVEVNPVFPAYGQEVSLLLQAGAPAYIPVTRYRIDGRNIILEVEHIAGGFFGPRLDMADLPLVLGEITPGSYSIQARLFDIGNPDAPPRIFTRSLEVVPPDSIGVYSVPRSPGAYANMQLLVNADGPVDATSMRATVNGYVVRIDFNFSADPSAPRFAAVKVNGLAPGAYRAEAYGSTPNVMAPPQRYSGDFSVGMTSTVVEYYADRLDHYFISAWPDEIAAIDNDAGAGFKRTGQAFKAWLHASDAPMSAVPVCRFYASGPNSHFYTADPAECQSLKSLEQKQKAEANVKGEAFRGWQFEAIAFYAVAPKNGSCPAGTQPVYRLYNDRAAQEDPNHRFTGQWIVRAAMSAARWYDEGLAFCSPA